MSQAAPPAPKRALGIIFLIVFMDLLGFGVIIPQLPFYARQYQATALQVTILFSIYSICQFAAAPILGAISDRIGRRPILIISQFGSALGYAMLGAVTHHQWANPLTGLMLVYVSRAIDGISGGNISTAQAYISDVTTPENRAKGMGILGAAFGIGFAAGPALGAFAGPEGYEFVPAYIAAGLSAIAAVMTFMLLPESHHAIRARDVALTKSTLEEDIATPVIPPALDEPEMSGASPVNGEVPPRDWLERIGVRAATRNPVLLQLLLLSFCSMAAFVMMESTVAIFLADTFNWGSRNVGYFFACIGVIIAVVQGGLIWRLTKAFGEWPLAITGPLCVAIGMACFARVGFSPWIALLMLGAATNAIGRSLQQPTVSSLISKFSDPREQGVIFGLYHGLSSVARVIGPIIAGLAYERHHTGPFIVAGSIAVVIVVWTLLVYYRATHRTQPVVVT
jgi:DHA1 family tetracycline resistance protein-like MFS transporter